MLPSPRILFLTSNRLGDAVLSSGVLARLIQDHPTARITVGCGPVATNLFDALPGLERLIEIRKQPYSLHWVRFWRQVCLTPWDIIADLRGAPLTRLTLSKRRIDLPKDRKSGHRVDMYARALKTPNQPPAPKIFVREADTVRARGLIEDQTVLALGPTANWWAKAWPPDRFGTLVHQLTAPGAPLSNARVALFGLASERASVQPLFDTLPTDQVIDLMGKVSLREAHECMALAKLYIGNDSGLMHLAAASGTPTLGLFGPSKEDHYRPWGSQAAAVRGASYEDTFPKDYDYTNVQENLMTSLSVDQVAAAAIELLNRA